MQFSCLQLDAVLVASVMDPETTIKGDRQHFELVDDEYGTIADDQQRRKASLLIRNAKAATDKASRSILAQRLAKKVKS